MRNVRESQLLSARAEQALAMTAAGEPDALRTVDRYFLTLARPMYVSSPIK